jgi:hypothetical protein
MAVFRHSCAVGAFGGVVVGEAWRQHQSSGASVSEAGAAQPTHTSTRTTKEIMPRTDAVISSQTANSRYDYILVGSGPGAAGWLHTTLCTSPHARILLLERGPDCQTDILTERNPFTLLRDSARVVASYAHGVMQGATLGGGTAVNNYAWITPSFADLQNALGIERTAATEQLVHECVRCHFFCILGHSTGVALALPWIYMVTG